MILQRPTVWHPPEHPCSSSRRSILDRDCRRATVQWRGRSSEIVVIHIEQNNEIRGTFPKYTQNPVLSYDALPFATIGGFHIHPNVSHGAAKDGVQKGIMPLVTEYHCDAITGDANKSANTFSKLQSVYNLEHGLMNYIMGKFKNLWNGTQDMPLAERMDVTMSTFCTIKNYCPSPSLHERRFRI